MVTPGNNEISPPALRLCSANFRTHKSFIGSPLHTTRYPCKIDEQVLTNIRGAGGWVRLGDPLDYENGQDVCNSQLAKTTHWISHACKWGTTHIHRETERESERAKLAGIIMSPALFNFAEETQTQMKWNGSQKAGGAFFAVTLLESVFLFVNVCMHVCVCLATTSVFFSLGRTSNLHSVKLRARSLSGWEKLLVRACLFFISAPHSSSRALSLSFAKWILPKKLLDLSSHLHPLADTNLNHQIRKAGLFGWNFLSF